MASFVRRTNSMMFLRLGLIILIVLGCIGFMQIEVLADEPSSSPPTAASTPTAPVPNPETQPPSPSASQSAPRLPKKKKKKSKNPAGEIQTYESSDEEDKVVIEACQVTYDERRVTAQGNVHVTYGDVTMETEALIFDPVTGILKSDGPVVFTQEGENTYGDFLSYNVNTREGTLACAVGKTKNIEVEDEPIREPLFYSAKTVNLEGNVIILKQADATTCDFPVEKRHYHISAEEIKIIPNDKMIISHGRLWLGKMPLWHVAKLVIDLKPQPYHKQSYVPHFGYNKVDGFFVKTVTNYEAYENNYGNVLLDVYQKTGMAAGFEHQFTIADRGSGHASFYHQNGSGFQNFTREQVSSNLQYDFGDKLKMSGNLSLFRYRIPPVISPDTYNTQATLNKQGKNFSWNLTESNNATSGYSNTQTIQFHHFQDFGRNIHGDFSEGLIQSNQNGSVTSSLHNLTNFSKHFNGWSADLSYEKTNASLLGGGFIDRTPEIALKTDDLKLKGFDLPYQLSLDFAKFFESFQNINTNRWDFQMNMPEHTIQVGKNSKFTTSSLYRQDFYDTGNFYQTRNLHARYILGNQTQFSTTIANHMDIAVDYRSQSDIGFDPLLYDTVQPYRYLGGELSFYNQDFWKLNVGTSYDYKNKFYQQVVSRLDVRPKPNWLFHFDAYYDPNQHQWQNLITSADFWPFSDIRLQYWSSFTLLNGQVGYQDMAVYKEWHDWEARLIYAWHQQEVFLFFNLKAFPAQQVQLGINPIVEGDPNASAYVIH